MDEVARSFETPDKALSFEHGFVEIANLAGTGGAVTRMVMRPGWRWTTDLGHVIGTDTCQTRHVGYCLEGSLHVELDGGATLEIKAGDLFVIPPGHDAWVDGQATCTILDWGSMATTAAPVGAPAQRPTRPRPSPARRGPRRPTPDADRTRT